jgi:uncharacterized protein (TIGR02569 family)
MDAVLGPPSAILDAFALDGDPHAIPGGEGRSFRVGDSVVKRVHDSGEAEWTQALLARTEPGGFRIPQPVRTADGHWVCDGWSASRFIAGLRSAAPRWSEIATAGLLFADAVECVRYGGEEILARRSHRWAFADRVAWGEAVPDLDAEAKEVYRAIEALLTEQAVGRQVVHGDLTGNVYLDPSGVPVILDFSPYLRPRRWAMAIVFGDAVLWNGADPSLAASFATDPTDRDLFGRALIFRLVSEQVARNPRHGAHLQPYRDVLAALR